MTSLQLRRQPRRHWSIKYKRSINCRRPRGFSQKQHCKYGRRKSNNGTRRIKLNQSSWITISYLLLLIILWKRSYCQWWKVLYISCIRVGLRVCCIVGRIGSLGNSIRPKYYSHQNRPSQWRPLRVLRRTRVKDAWTDYINSTFRYSKYEEDPLWKKRGVSTSICTVNYK